MSATLEEMFNKDSILDVSFFNFENAITAAYFADAELNIVKANKNFKALFPNIKNIEGFNILALLGGLGFLWGSIGALFSIMDDRELSRKSR